MYSAKHELLDVNNKADKLTASVTSTCMQRDGFCAHKRTIFYNIHSHDSARSQSKDHPRTFIIENYWITRVTEFMNNP